MDLKPRSSREGKIDAINLGWRLMIPKGPAGRYRLSQLDDHLGLERSEYPWYPPLTVSLRARVSSTKAPGTWGFGLWNDPFGFSFGPGEGFFHLPALPNTVWFFSASSKNHLSFRDDKPGQGFLAQVFRSPRFDFKLFIAGLVFPFSRKASRRMLSRVIAEDASLLSTNVNEWHTYRFQWSLAGSTFWVDENIVLETPISPVPPLGIVIWIDNQYAAFTPDGIIRWGLEENPESEWLEIEQVEVRDTGRDYG